FQPMDEFPLWGSLQDDQSTMAKQRMPFPPLRRIQLEELPRYTSVANRHTAFEQSPCFLDRWVAISRDALDSREVECRTSPAFVGENDRYPDRSQAGFSTQGCLCVHIPLA